MCDSVSLRNEREATAVILQQFGCLKDLNHGVNKNHADVEEGNLTRQPALNEEHQAAKEG